MTLLGQCGFKGTQHIGFTVPDMDEALAFFVGVLGAEPLFRVGPIAVDVARAVKYDVPEGAILTKIVMLRIADGPNVELFEYDRDHQRAQPPPRVNDAGGHHWAVEVADLKAAVGELKRAGVRVLGEPSEVTMGPLAGLRWVYAVTAWGLIVEFIERPSSGLAWEHQAGRNLYRP